MRQFVRTLLISSLSLFAACSFAQIAAPNRIAARGISSGGDAASVPLAGTIPMRARHAVDLGVVPADTPLQSLTIRFNLSAAQNAALAQLENDQQNPNSARYRQWLTPEQYGAQFGLSVADLTAVSAWLQAQGFANVTAARSRTFISFAGTAVQVQTAFQTTLHTVSADGETHVANLTEPAVPAALSGVVSTITGLNDFRLKPRVQARTVPAPDPKFTSSISGNHYIAPGDFYTIYDINPLLNNSINGAGVTIAVMGQTDISLPDVASFRSASLLPAKAPTVLVYGTDPGTSTNDLEEAMLDVEWSGATAPGANVLYVNSTNVISGSLTQAINNNVAPIITISYGDCETGFGSANLASFNQLFRQATVQGQTIVGPAGDSGATDCDYQSTSATSGLAVDFPASSPYVTGVGGTMFNEAGGTYFSTSNGAYSGSALSYIPEAVWNESVAGVGLASGGGGLSAYFTKPAYQVGTGVHNDFARDVPDISFDAAASHDGYLLCYSGSCTNGYRNLNNNLQVVGGTSVSTPAYAGILALLEQKIGARVGNANPTIYGLANSQYYSTVFHDTTVGNNASPCTAGSTNCPPSGTVGYNATTGYDLASGWGSLDVNNMIADWLLVTPTGLTGSSIGILVSTTTVTSSNASVTAGASVTFTASVGSTNNNSASQPTGTVQFLVDNVPSGSGVALVNGSASFTLATTGLSSGGHYVTAAYSGNAVYAGSKGQFTLDIIAAAVADFSLTPATTTVTTAAGSTAPGVTFMVNPTNGFTGTVTFSATTTSNTLNVNLPTFLPPSVNITSTASGSTVFTLFAYASQAQGTVGTLLVKSAADRSSVQPLTVAGGGLSLALLGFLVLPRRRRRWSALLVALVGVGLLSASGCGSGGDITNGVTKTNAAPGTYTIIVTASGTSATGVVVTHNSTVTFVVQ